MRAKSQRGVLKYLRQHSTKNLYVTMRCSKAEKDRKRDPNQAMLVQVFALPGPEHNRTPTQTEIHEIGEAIDTIADGPEPLIFFAARKDATYFIKNLDAYRAEAMQS